MTTMQRRLAVYSAPFCLLFISCGGGKPKITDQSQPATIERFEVQPKEITAGDSAQLLVKYSQGTGSIEPNPGAPDKDGIYHLSPDKTETYTLTVKGINLPISRAVTLTVHPQPQADIKAPENVAPGQPECAASVLEQPGLTYLWTVENATITAGQDTHAIRFTAPDSGTVNITCVISNPLGVKAEDKTTVEARDNGLVLNVVGAPNTSGPQLTLTGPEGYSNIVSGSQTLPNLKPGTYTVTAPSFTHNGLNFHPWRPTQTIEVKPGEQPTLTVQYPLPLYVAMIPDVAPPARPKRMVPMEFVLIPAGKFDMGSLTSERTRPIKTVTFATAFYMARTECTQTQWNVLINVNNSEPKGDDFPINNVSWDMVRATGGYLDLLNKHLPDKRFGLPSEAQWEYSYRTGLPVEFPFADSDMKQYMWFADNSGKSLQPAATTNQSGAPEEKPSAEVFANPWGLCDMGGNVWEFVEDQYHPSHEGAKADGSPWKDPNGDTGLRVFKGGYFGSGSIDCTTWARSAAPPSLPAPHYGFRLVMTEPQFEHPGIAANLGVEQEWCLGDFEPVDLSKTYRVTAQSLAWPKTEGAMIFIGLAEYDEDKNRIISLNRMFYQHKDASNNSISSCTRLAKTIEPGDKEIYLESVAGWANQPQLWRRGVTLWNWVDSQGKAYEPGTYSRNVFYNCFSEGNPVNVEKSFIQLKDSWSTISKETYPAGTVISQSDSALLHRYCTASGVNAPSRWTTHTGKIGSIGQPNTNDMHQFTPATRFVKIFIWAGYPKKLGESVYFCNWKLEPVN